MERSSIYASDLIHKVGIMVMAITKGVNIVRVVFKLFIPIIEEVFNNKASFVEPLVVLTVGKKNNSGDLVFGLSG